MPVLIDLNIFLYVLGDKTCEVPTNTRHRVKSLHSSMIVFLMVFITHKPQTQLFAFKPVVWYRISSLFLMRLLKP